MKNNALYLHIEFHSWLVEFVTPQRQYSGLNIPLYLSVWYTKGVL